MKRQRGGWKTGRCHAEVQVRVSGSHKGENGGRGKIKKKDQWGIIRPTPGRGVWQVKGQIEGKQGWKMDGCWGDEEETGLMARTWWHSKGKGRKKRKGKAKAWLKRWQAQRERKKEERRGGQPGGQRFKSEGRKKAEREAEEEVTETDAEHENALCHPLSNTEPEDKGSVSASERESCFFQHLLDDNSHLSPHQKERRGESTEHTVLHVSSSSLASLVCPPQTRFLF